MAEFPKWVRELAAKRRHWSETDAERLITLADSRGLSLKGLGEAIGVDSSRLYQWRRRLAARPAGTVDAAATSTVSGFVPALISPASAGAPAPGRADSCIRIVTPSGFVVSVGAESDERALRLVLSALRSAEAC
jgi:transposase-like protein